MFSSITVAFKAMVSRHSKTLKEGQSVIFDIVQDMKGPKAINVQLLLGSQHSLRITICKPDAPKMKREV